MAFKVGQKVKASFEGNREWGHQIGKSKFGTVLKSIHDGTKRGGFPYTIQWENGTINTYREKDVERFVTSLENK
ncbi:MAG: hypothetical protein [Caudoviricetes sp.]|nr:MAG: hypothetical protein [Caudoviricetes sp.]